ncbi:AAA family ATPase [Clostridium estertheticum]|uniref:AAA family ATPase n=1 Tax=Clostridium estertheticum TaxID=238834 RepID=UPI001C0E4811|nr:ATP-binding protein [Clostridium estertheticum]MBU3198322.1 AAA family ATPase [Clostridium estertheticum]WAG65009.1 AAA family ATPase [Clostridium estertheticum]
MTYIKSIEAKEQLINYKFSSKEKGISNISKINIFIGSNNSGKSRYLRNIFLDNELKFNIGTKEINDYNIFIEMLNKEINEIFKNTNIFQVGKIKADNSLVKVDYVVENDNNAELFSNLMSNLKNVKESDGVTQGSYGAYSANEICKRLNSIPDKYIEDFNYRGFKEILFKKKFKRIYIPILRGLRKLGEVDDILRKRTINDYFVGADDIDVFTGQNLYKEVLGLLCGDFRDRNHLKEFEMFLGNNFFDGKIISLIPKIDSDVLYVKIGEEKEYPIYNLGDGIQSIIILTFNLFAERGKDVLFFIEEPELYLHPGLQRKVIEIFSKKEFDTFQYFMTSHSNHLLDLTLDIKDISVYKFCKEINNGNDLEKDAEFVVENVNNEDTSVLELLGVNNSAIFLSNCTIWVEGITDRLYIRKFLEIYQNETENIEKIFSEDLHYSFLEYCGGNITHWDFLDDSQGELSPMKHSKICNKIFLIADSDGYNTIKEGMKSDRLKALEDYFGEKFYCLKAKEIENILTPNIIKTTVYKFDDGRIKNPVNRQDGKLFNEVEFLIEDYKELNLGKFINDKINERIEVLKAKDNNYAYEKRKNFKKGNTINNKIIFCKYAIEDIKKLSDMSNDAIELCEKIYNFIKENN